jgi:hypothetical protein
MESRNNAQEAIGASIVAGRSFVENFPGVSLLYSVECFDKHGNLKWEEPNRHNIVTTEGGNFMLDKFFAGSAYTAAWFLGLMNGTAPVIGDTAVSHAGWAEVTPYTGTRPSLVLSTGAAAKSKAATLVPFAITGTATVSGAFVQSVNTGTTGTLYSASNFTTARSVVNGDTLNCTVTFTV